MRSDWRKEVTWRDEEGLLEGFPEESELACENRSKQLCLASGTLVALHYSSGA
jgi:hypothetical protein